MSAAIKNKPTSKRKTWAEKMLPDKVAVVKICESDFADIPAGSTMLIATPTIVDKYIRQIPKGKFTDIKQIRKDLAAENNAEYSCPVTTGIFLRIVSENANEELQKGKSINKITPFWRVLNAKSPAAKKLSFGTDLLIQQQKKEGIIK